MAAISEDQIPDFIHTPVSRSPQEAALRKPFGKYGQMSRLGIQAYIASFLDSDGPNRKLLEVSNMDFAVKYVTDFELDTPGGDSKIHIQLARMFSQLTQKIPAILILDSNISPVASSLGDWGSGRKNAHGVNELELLFDANVSITIICVGYDETMVGRLRDVMLSIFGTPLRRLAGGNTIESSLAGANYALTIGLTPPSMPELSNSNVGDDPITKYHYFSFSLESHLECVKVVCYKDTITADVAAHAIGGVRTIINEDGTESNVYVANTMDEAFPMSFDMPSTIRVGNSIPVVASNERAGVDYYVNNPDVAYLDRSMLILTAKRRGTVTLFATVGHTTVASKEFVIQ